LWLATCTSAPTSDSSEAGASTTAHIVERERLSMGSEVRLTAWTSDEARALRAFERVFDEFDRLDRLLSVWHPESDVARVNAAAGQHPVSIQRDTMDVLQVARRVSDWTNGKFDVTFGALSGLWKFDHDQDDQIPAPALIGARLPLVDYQQLVVDDRAATAFLRRAGMRLHLGGIGKGYAVDRGAAILHDQGIDDFLIQAGGDLYAAGRRGDRAWRSGIRDPRGPPDRIFAVMDLHDETFSTSGDYERFFMRGGRRYHHILDPDEGQPAHGCRSVTIVAKQSVLADGLSTGVFVLGPQAGMALIEKLPDVEGVIVTSENAVIVSTGLSGRLELRQLPTDAP
jgi:FAD:protein FMN transferase